jgi:hypothetical protein
LRLTGLCACFFMALPSFIELWSPRYQDLGCRPAHQPYAHRSGIRSFERVTAYPEVIPKKCGSVRIGDHPETSWETGLNER